MQLIGQGAATKVYRIDDKAIKVFSNVPYAQVEEEFFKQQFAYQAGLPVPPVFNISQNGSTIILEMAYIEGKNSMYPGMKGSEVKRLINVLIDIQQQIHLVEVSNNHFPSQIKRLQERITSSIYLDDFQKTSILSILASEMPLKNNLCHGDFHPLNVLFRDSNYYIIDWADATFGNPLIDIARTYIIFKQYLLRYANYYLTTFCSKLNIEKLAITKWLPVVIGARLSENMDKKSRARLLIMLKETNI